MKWFATTIVALALVACAGQQKVDPANYTEAAEYAYDRAERAFERKDYELARALYTEVYQEYPYSRYAALSELRIADSFRKERSYLRAIEAYRRFVRFHPSHARVAEAEFRISQSYYQQMPGDWWLMPPSYERDLSSAREAHRALRLFTERYPSSEFAAEAEDLLEQVIDRLAAHELYVAEYYSGEENAVAAGRRASHLVETYPTSSHVPAALFLYARSLLMLDDVEQAIATLRRLINDHPDTEMARRAERYMEEHGL